MKNILLYVGASMAFLALCLGYCNQREVTRWGAQWQQRLTADSTVRARDSTQQATMNGQLALSAYVIDPSDTILFFGRRVPLEQPWVRQQLQAEVWFFLQHRGDVLNVWQRVGYFGPVITLAIARYDLPADVFYLFIVENYLRVRGLSNKDAEGIAQLLVKPARRHGLRVDVGEAPVVDERRNPLLAIDVACRILQQNYRDFGSWELACAAYNAGAARVSSFKSAQESDDFYSMLFAVQTQRYLYEMLAFKLIFSRPEYYLPGIERVPQQLSVKLALQKTKVKTKTTIADLAASLGLSLDQFWQYNQQIYPRWIPPGTYTVVVPQP